MSPSKGNDGHRVKSGSKGLLSGTRLTLAQAARHCPESIFDDAGDAPFTVQTPPDRSTEVTFCGQRDPPQVIHRSYPQAPPFHVKPDVERLHALWILRWTTADPSALFHVKRGAAPFSTALAHSLWILPGADLPTPAVPPATTVIHRRP
jgi:hypothetical protein